LESVAQFVEQVVPHTCSFANLSYAVPKGYNGSGVRLRSHIILSGIANDRYRFHRHDGDREPSRVI